jgi:hypothetical protein
LLPELGTETGLHSDREIADILKQNKPGFEKYLNYQASTGKEGAGTSLIEHLL